MGKVETPEKDVLSARFLLWLACVAILLLLCTVQPARAQNIPQGSPLDPRLGVAERLQQQASQSDTQVRSDGQGAPPEIESGGQEFRPVQVESSASSDTPSKEDVQRTQAGVLDRSDRVKRAAEPGEFEIYVKTLLGRPLRRFGQDLILPAQRDFAAPSTASIPPDYMLNVGDMVSISLSGTLEGSVNRKIDTNGNIYLAKVGTIRLAGVRYADAKDRIAAAIGTQFRGFGVNVAVRELRGIRVYVTGFANNPGAFTINSLSTLANAVFQAGGPTSGGSFRGIKLYRNGRQIADFDLYDLVRKGSKINDLVLQNEDVIFIPAAGEQVAVFGSVQQEAIYEAKPGETIEDLLAIAGGPNALGDPGRVILYRSRNTAVIGPQEFSRDAARTQVMQGGDLIQILSEGSLIRPVAQQSVLVRIEGEVNRPGEYYVPANTSMSTLMDLAGGLTNRAFPYGTKFIRRTVREQQRDGFKDAIAQLEMTLAMAPLNNRSENTAEERAAQLTAAREVLDRLRKAEPDGRLVMNLMPSSTALSANILLEANDNVIVPPRPSAVGVFGAVYRPASFLIETDGAQITDYIERAGGVLRAADKGNIFVIRASGEVLTRKRGALKAAAVPGDVIFVPVKANSSSFWAKLREITTIVFQLGVTAAAVQAIGN